MARLIQVGEDVAEFPDEMTDQDIEKVLSSQGSQSPSLGSRVAGTAKTLSRIPLAQLETAASVGSGMVGTMAAGLASPLAMTLKDPIGGGAARAEAIQRKLTYEPRTEEGKFLTTIAGEAMAAPAKAYAWLEEKKAELMARPFVGKDRAKAMSQVGQPISEFGANAAMMALPVPAMRGKPAVLPPRLPEAYTGPVPPLRPAARSAQAMQEAWMAEAAQRQSALDAAMLRERLASQDRPAVRGLLPERTSGPYPRSVEQSLVQSQVAGVPSREATYTIESMPDVASRIATREDAIQPRSMTTMEAIPPRPLPEGMRSAPIPKQAKPLPEKPIVTGGETAKLNRQYGELPKGTEVQLTGKKNPSELTDETEVILPDGKARMVPTAWISKSLGGTESLPSMVKRMGRQKVESLIGDWDSNASLSPDGNSITTFSDARNRTGVTRASSREFAQWVKDNAEPMPERVVPQPTQPASATPPPEVPKATASYSKKNTPTYRQGTVAGAINDFLNEIGGPINTSLKKSGSRDYAQRLNDMNVTIRRQAFTQKGGMSLDEAAQAARDRGLIKPDATIDDFLDHLETLAKPVPKEPGAAKYVQEYKEYQSLTTKSKGTEPVLGMDLQPGDTFTHKGTKHTVQGADGGDVRIKNKIELVVPIDQTIFVDKGSMGVAETVLPKKLPTSLIPESDMPFNLSGQKAADAPGFAEKLAQDDATAQAQALQEKQQGKLFGSESGALNIFDRKRSGKEPPPIPGVAAPSQAQQRMTGFQSQLRSTMTEMDRKWAEQIPNIEETGTIQPKESRPEYAKGKPAAKESVVSVKLEEDALNRWAGLVNDWKRVEAEAYRTGDPAGVDTAVAIGKQVRAAREQLQELRRTAHESLYFWNRSKDLMAVIDKQIGLAPEIKQRLPILNQIVSDIRGKKWSRMPADVTRFLTANLFTVGSWTLDFTTNALMLGAELPGRAAIDVMDLAGGKPVTHMKGLLESMWANKRNLSLRSESNRFRTNPQIEQQLGTTAGGEQMGGPKQVMLDVAEYGAPAWMNVVDYPLSAPIRMKRSVDSAFGRTMAAADVYTKAWAEAGKQGLKGVDARAFVNNYFKNPPAEVVESAVKLGNEAKFNRPLPPLLEAVAGNTMTKLVVDAFPRWGMQFTMAAGDLLGMNPKMMKKIATGQASRNEIVRYLSRAATGWGAVWMWDKLFYDKVDTNTMELVRDDKSRVRLSNRTPGPELTFITAMLRGDWMRAKQAVPYISFPGSRWASGEPGGIISPISDAARDSFDGKYTAHQTATAFAEAMNNAIPGKSTLGFMRSLMDPTIREGFGAPIPGYASTLPQKINPTTGKPSAPEQEFLGVRMATVGGTPLPGAVRIQNDVEKELAYHGIIRVRPRRTPVLNLPAEDVPQPLRKEFESLSGKYVGLFVSELMQSKGYKEAPREYKRKALSEALGYARQVAKYDLAKKYKVMEPPSRQETVSEQGLPPAYK